MNLRPKAHIHFMGICGVGMASLASLLHQKGFKITGSDENIYPPMSTHLHSLGIPVFKSYKKENLTPSIDLVVVGNVIFRNNKEAQALLKLGLSYTSWPQALMDLVVQDTKTIVISGTHGKTTTSSMVSCVADELWYQIRLSYWRNTERKGQNFFFLP